jgi:hypothetical protein
MVLPLILRAAIQVGASTAIFFWVLAINARKSVDFPVPAFQVKKILSGVFSAV